MTNATDIEIYVKELSTDQAIEWLTSVFENITIEAKKKGMPKKAQPLRIQFQNKDFFAMIFENVTPDYTSIWLDSSQLPWPDDEKCGIDAAKFLGKTVRITAGGWQQNSNPDAWLEISETGETAEITWKTE